MRSRKNEVTWPSDFWILTYFRCRIWWLSWSFKFKLFRTCRNKVWNQPLKNCEIDIRDFSISWCSTHTVYPTLIWWTERLEGSLMKKKEWCKTSFDIPIFIFIRADHFVNVKDHPPGLNRTIRCPFNDSRKVIWYGFLERFLKFISWTMSIKPQLMLWICERTTVVVCTFSVKTVTNISKLSPTHFVSNIRHQHRCGPMFQKRALTQRLWDFQEISENRHRSCIFETCVKVPEWSFFFIKPNNLLAISIN